MGHLAVKTAYKDLQNRLEQMPVGAPGTGTIYEILKLIFTEPEARLAAQLPLRFSTLGAISRKTKLPLSELQPRLEAMADKGLVLDFFIGNKMRYMLAPTVVGLFEFSMMRVRDDIDQQKLAQLIFRYVAEEPDFSGQFKDSTETALFRTLVHEKALPQDYTEVLDWEKASRVVEMANMWAVGICHCRHSAHHRGKDCEVFPMESCLSLNGAADYLTRHKLARPIEKQEMLDILEQTREAGMIHLADNIKNVPTFICNCCSCCCEVLHAFRNFEFFGTTMSSNFEARVERSACTGCGECVKACPVELIQRVKDRHQVGEKRYPKLAQVDHSACLGCGVCVAKCKFEALHMAPRAQRRIAPSGTIARTLTMALEQGKLHNLLADNQNGLTAQAANLLLGAICNLPPGKQLLARQEVKSRFVDFALSRMRKKPAKKA